jgi:chromosome segregation ATPase
MSRTSLRSIAVVRSIADQTAELDKQLKKRDELIAERDAEIKKLSERINELEARVAGLESDLDSIEDEAEEHSLARLGLYRSLITDLDALFGLRRLPIGLRMQLDALEAEL